MKTITAAAAAIQTSLFDSIASAGKWECPWFKDLFSFHNPLSNAGQGHTFTGFVNLAILAMTSNARGWSDPRFVTAAQVRKSKGQWWIRKDEFNKGLTLFFPRFAKDKATGESVFNGWGFYRVYNAEQCEKAPELPTLEGREFNPIDACEVTVAGMPLCPPIEHKGGTACYSPIADRVTMPPREAFKSAEEYYSTLFHELAHATAHKSRLARDKDGEGRLDEYAREELVAETAAAILCAVHGIEGRTIENSKAYVAGWKSRCNDDPKLFGRSMREALAAVEWIMGKRQPKATPKPEAL